MALLFRLELVPVICTCEVLPVQTIARPLQKTKPWEKEPNVVCEKEDSFLPRRLAFGDDDGYGSSGYVADGHNEESLPDSKLNDQPCGGNFWETMLEDIRRANEENNAEIWLNSFKIVQHSLGSDSDPDNICLFEIVVLLCMGC